MNWRFLGYTWGVLLNIFYTAVVAFVLSRTGERDLTIIIATIGLVYTAVRGVTANQFLSVNPMLGFIMEAVNDIKELHGLPPSSTSEEYVSTAKLVKVMQTTNYISSSFLLIINVICLFALFNAL
jgi:hypothetical protein